MTTKTAKIFAYHCKKNFAQKCNYLWGFGGFILRKTVDVWN